MSIFSNLLEVGKSLVVGLIDAPLDGRTRVDTIDDIPDIPNPFVGMKIYCRADKKTYTVHSLKAKTIGSVTIENRQIDEYKTDAYTAGENITISKDNVISATAAKYTAGSCIDITGNVVSLQIADERGFNVLNTGLSLNFEVIATQDDVFAVDQKVNGLQETVTDIGNSLGDINTILDEINGEEL